MQGEKGISIKCLSYAYGDKQALDQVSFSVQSGRFTALLGPNGAGKSTLISLLSGLFSPAAGTIEILGFDFVKQPRPALACMGIVFQQQTLDLDLSVDQNMRYAAALRGLQGKDVKARIAAALAEMDLTSRSHDPARSLNSGHRRRLEIARALVHRPKCLILDEPTVGLDVPSRNGLVEQLHQLCRDDGLTVLWATHLVDEVWPHDDLIILDQGTVRAAGAVTAVLEEQEATDVLAAFTKLTSPTKGGRS